MKTFNVLTLLVVLGMALSASAERKYGMAGCGLGSLVFDKSGSQITAATLNATGQQSFAITSGTSNCNEDGMVRRSREAKLFIEVNKEVLAKDISRGEGETIKSLSHLYHCEDVAQLGAGLQKEYGAIFPSQDVSTDQVASQILEVIHQDKELAASCRI